MKMIPWLTIPLWQVKEFQGVLTTGVFIRDILKQSPTPPKRGTTLTERARGSSNLLTLAVVSGSCP